jgi:hypothetical protein
MIYPIKLSRYHPERYLPHGLRFKISKLHKIDDHLYSFNIYHPDCKYLDTDLVSSMQLNYVHYKQLELTEETYENPTQEDYISGKVKGGCIKIRYYEPVTDILLKIVPLKWETQVFIIPSIGGDIWEYEE